MGTGVNVNMENEKSWERFVTSEYVGRSKEVKDLMRYINGQKVESWVFDLGSEAVSDNDKVRDVTVGVGC